MLHKCANPACPSLFRSLRHGKLLPVGDRLCRSAWVRSCPVSRRERLARRVERYWLCDCCSSLLTLTLNAGGAWLQFRYLPGIRICQLCI